MSKILSSPFSRTPVISYILRILHFKNKNAIVIVFKLQCFRGERYFFAYTLLSAMNVLIKYSRQFLSLSPRGTLGEKFGRISTEKLETK